MSSSGPSNGPTSRQALTCAFPRDPGTDWLNVAALLADVAFETDEFGRFTAFGQNDVLGIPATRLIGTAVSDFCTLTGDDAAASNGFAAIFTGLRQQSLIWRGVVSVQRAGRSAGVYQILLAPKPMDEAGEKARRRDDIAGAYGLLIDMDAPGLQKLSPAPGRAAGMLDPQTGLWSSATFAEEAGRRFDRLDVEGLPGTLLLLGFGRTPAVGHKAVAERLAEELRDVSRPTDILGRVSATVFGLWCDGMDDLTGAERAVRFCRFLPAALPGSPCISVGLVARWPGNMEDPATLITQAGMALKHAESVAQAAADAGSTEPLVKGTWRVWNPPRKE